MAIVENGELHVLFVPYFTPSHMMPLVDAARIFAAQGVKVTIIATPANAALFKSSVDRDIELGRKIFIQTFPFPAAAVGLPEGIENFNLATSIEMLSKLMRAIFILQNSMEKLILDISPHCIMSDRLLPWTVDVAEKLKIPRFSFHALSFFHHCLGHNLEKYAPDKNTHSDSGCFLIPNLPHKIELKMSQIEDYGANAFAKVMDAVKEAELRSYGAVHDTVLELEPAYAEYYQRVRGKKSWSIGPLFHFSNREKSNLEADKESCLNWLDSQQHNQVLYICFGSLVNFPDPQLKEIALALEASNYPFIWVVRTPNDKESWFPSGFEDKMIKNGKGFIVKGWAPQLKILNHPATGGFMTHCGWNSTLEAITAGVPMITWPLFAEQFYNEKFVQVMHFGVRVGAEARNLVPQMLTAPLIESKQIQEAIQRLMCGSEESVAIREKVKEAAAISKRAVEEGGSSYENVVALIEEMKSFAFGKNK